LTQLGSRVCIAALPAADRSLPLHVRFANDAAVFVIFFAWQIGRARAAYPDGKNSPRDYGRVVFELNPLRDSPHVNDKVKLTEAEIQTLSPMRLPG
jgi:hypothetical protein